MTTGFVRGFDVGFNAVNSALRLAQMKEDSERRNKREDEKWGYEKGELDRRKTLVSDLASAGDEPTRGVAVGAPGARNFAASPDDQAFLKDQDAAIADLQGTKPSAATLAVGAGRNVVDPSDPRAQSGRRGYAARAADAYRKAGEVDKAFSIEDAQREFESARIEDAAKHLFATGDVAGTQRIWEEANGPLGGTLVAQKVERVGADGTKVPDFQLSVVDGKGNVVEDMGSAFTMLYMAKNPAEYLKLVQGEQKSKADSDNAAAKLALDERRVGVLEQNAQTMEGYRRDQVALARERAAAGGSQEAPEGPQFAVPSMSDQKAIREAVSASIGEGQDENVASDLATRLVMANPTLTAAEAARMATTPGIQVRNVTTNVGVLPALVSPDGKAVLLAPGANAWQAPPAQVPKEEPSATAKAVGKFVDKAGDLGRALVTPRDRTKEEREAKPAPAKPSPAQIATQPAREPRQQYQNAINALRAESRRLLDAAASAQDPREQARLRKQAEAIEAQAQRQERAAGAR